jgi:hypothetical protein
MVNSALSSPELIEKVSELFSPSLALIVATEVPPSNNDKAPGSEMVGAVLVTCIDPGEELPSPPPPHADRQAVNNKVQ